MIIDCPWCKKKFEIDPSLIPEKGRLLQCGSCEQTWFFDRKQNDYSKPITNIPNTENKLVTTSPKKNINKKLSIKDKALLVIKIIRYNYHHNCYYNNMSSLFSS